MLFSWIFTLMTTHVSKMYTHWRFHVIVMKHSWNFPTTIVWTWKRRDTTRVSIDTTLEMISSHCVISEVSCLQFILSLNRPPCVSHKPPTHTERLKLFMYLGDSLSTLRLSRNANEIKTKFAKPNFVKYLLNSYATIQPWYDKFW